jgi:hypothetical protein
MHAASVFADDDALWMVAGNNLGRDVGKLVAVAEPSIGLLLVPAAVLWLRRGSPRSRHAASRFYDSFHSTADVTR